MTKILFITVGGSHPPVVTSINTLQPDRIIFICSDDTDTSRGSKSQIIGQDKPCEVRNKDGSIERFPNIPTMLGLGERFQEDRDLVLIKDPDDLSECYRKISDCVLNIKKDITNAEIMADYTGSTKTMSVGLAMVAMDYQILMYVTSTSRKNLIRVEEGELTEKASTTPVVVERIIKQLIPIFLKEYNYQAAISQLKHPLQSMELQPDLKRHIRDLHTYCNAFDAWDRFDHRTAWARLQPYMKQPNIQPYGLFLKKVIASRGQLDIGFDNSDGVSGHGYEVVEDLLLNADRRASQQRYDDAVGRLYRAIELLEQIRLFKNYGILTGDVDVLKLPESLQAEYEKMRSSRNHKIMISLFQSYELLSKLGEDPLGKLFVLHRGEIQNSLEVRNNSLLAHGFEPVNESRYRSFYSVIGSFIQEGITSVISSKSKSSSLQFPQSL
jgi:CRISPR-associated protein (TIGR02710 family)